MHHRNYTFLHLFAIIVFAKVQRSCENEGINYYPRVGQYDDIDMLMAYRY